MSDEVKKIIVLCICCLVDVWYVKLLSHGGLNCLIDVWYVRLRSHGGLNCLVAGRS